MMNIHSFSLLTTMPFFGDDFYFIVFRRVQKLRKANISFVMSVRLCLFVCPHATRLPLDGFWWNFTSDIYYKICRENSSHIKIQKEELILYMKKFSHLWQYLAEYLLLWEIFQINVVEKIKIHILCSVAFFQKLCRLWDIVEKYDRAWEVADGSMATRSMLD